MGIYKLTRKSLEEGVKDFDEYYVGEGMKKVLDFMAHPNEARLESIQYLGNALCADEGLANYVKERREEKNAWMK